MHELLTPAEMADADRRTIAAGTPGSALMERAGRAVAEAVAARHPLGTRIMVACGPGNNGGDGFVAARILRERGYRVRVLLLGSREALKGDAAEAAKLWPEPVERISAAALADAGVIVDALFGAGLARDLEGEAKAAVETVAAAKVPIVAVDLPSGIDGATGKVRGAAVKAVATVTFCRRKPGHLLLPGRLHAGQIEIADIGISDATVAAIKPKTFANEPVLWRRLFPVPRLDGHKYDRGHAVVVSGPAHATGAARLSARAALRAGAGLVTVAAPKAALPVLAASLTAVMVRDVKGAHGLTKLLADSRFNAVLLGPGQGVGAATGAMVVAAAKAKRLLVLDADALSSFSESIESLKRALSSAAAAVLTPHEGEFKRLFSRDSQILRQESKVERVRLSAARLGAVVLLKGPDTVVAAPDGRAAIAANGPPWLATAGSGDVLSGLVVGLLAQGMPAFEAACAAVWLHGECGQEIGPGLIAEDLSEALPRVLRRLLDLNGRSSSA
ncbi:MAG: NAD(P)H-hydrate dehydratase [Xanthobacteraceae bacterium]|nr:NAD(P)H-hydrate dehydratase [Xanthobacteraceae bacterium]